MMEKTFKAACVQMTSGPDIAENLKQAEGFIREAAAAGAQFISTPENTDVLTSTKRPISRDFVEEKDHPGIKIFSAMAKELGIWLHIGSLKVKLPKKNANRAYVFSPEGKEVARYDKIHMFDVDLPNGETYRESSSYVPGDKAAMFDTGFAKVGLSICYDLRFPHLYRDMAKKGADILCIPAAFTVPTGKAHWHVLQRARAIETGCFVIAAAQCGNNDMERHTFGHSLIISPWGEVLADGGDTPGIIITDIDIEAVENARNAVPSLKHDKGYSFH